MSLSALFRRLGAPLANARWSWGSVRGADGVVFLRVWQDRVKRLDDTLFVKISHHGSYVNDPNNLGYQERNGHVDAIRAGSGCYLVMCQAADISARPRTVRDFNDQEVFVGGRLREIDGETWIEVVRRVPVREAQL